MLSIHKLRIQLPPDRRDRAALIGRLVAEALAERPLAESLRIERLTLPPVRVRPGASDRQMARSIAGAIHARLQSEKGKA